MIASDGAYRLESKKYGTFARLSDKWAKWVVKLMDHGLCRLEGKLIFPPAKVRTGALSSPSPELTPSS